MIELKNSNLIVNINTKGAELQNLIKNGVEFLWQANSTFWPRKAPILFPIVGRVIDNQYEVNGSSFSLPQHGFARDQEFRLVKSIENEASFLLVSDETSKKVYPFEFELELSYRLEGSSVQISQRVANPGKETMFYALGNHPGFRCPLFENETYEDYYLEFEYPEVLSTYRLQNGYLSDRKETVLNGSNIIKLHYGLFKEDALIFNLTECKSRFIVLRNARNKHGVKVDFRDFSWLGIWSKPGPFVCIEPWAGVTDRFDHNKDFTKKTAIETLKPGEERIYRWNIEIV
jgi:galactose mutarotase-like enzyme